MAGIDWNVTLVVAGALLIVAAVLLRDRGEQ